MFDIGFSELFVVAVVALLVLGPERLPKAARFAGLWVRRARAQWYSVKSEWENELADDELKRSLRETRDQLEQAQDRLRDSGRELQNEFESVRHGGRRRDGERRPPPQREPDPDAPAEREPATGEPAVEEPGEPAPAQREPEPGPRPASRGAARELPRRGPAAAAPVAGESASSTGDNAQAGGASLDWREQQRREHELIERELDEFDPAADDDDEALQVGPRTRPSAPADDSDDSADAPATGTPRAPDTEHHTRTDTDGPRPRDPSRDHDRR